MDRWTDEGCLAYILFKRTTTKTFPNPVTSGAKNTQWLQSWRNQKPPPRKSSYDDVCVDLPPLPVALPKVTVDTRERHDYSQPALQSNPQPTPGAWWNLARARNQRQCRPRLADRLMAQQNSASYHRNWPRYADKKKEEEEEKKSGFCEASSSASPLPGTMPVILTSEWSSGRGASKNSLWGLPSGAFPSQSK